MIAAIVGELVLGWLLADFIGGVIHWWEDRIAREHWPVIGRHVVLPNRAHHARPSTFTEGGLLVRNGTTWLAAGVISLAWLAAFGPSVLWAAASAGGLLSSQVHFWAHAPARAPRWVLALQQAGIVQGPAHHGGHHARETTRYCVLTGLLNPLLDAAGFWRRLEQLLARFGVGTEARA